MPVEVQVNVHSRDATIDSHPITRRLTENVVGLVPVPLKVRARWVLVLFVVVLLRNARELIKTALFNAPFS